MDREEKWRPLCSHLRSGFGDAYRLGKETEEEEKVGPKGRHLTKISGIINGE